MIKKFYVEQLPHKRPKAGLSSISTPAQIWVTNDIRDFAGFWPRSNSLGEARCYAFQCADILELHCETFIPALKADPWFVAVLNDKDEPLMLFPFMVEHTKHISTMRFIDGAISDYNAPVLFPPVQEWGAETFRMIWQELKKRLPFDIAIFEKIPSYVGALQNPMMSLIKSPQGHSCHLLSLSGTWEDFSKTLPRRKEMQKKTRRIKELGNVTFEIAESPAQYDVLIAALIQQKKRRDLEARGFDSLDRPGFRSYLVEARRLVYPSGPVALFGLRLNDTIIAAHWGYVVGSRFSSLIPSFEAGKWYTYSPGFILTDMILEWCFAKGLDTFDYGFGDEPYKREYCDVSISLFREEIPSTIRGLIVPGIRNFKRQVAKTKFWIRNG